MTIPVLICLWIATISFIVAFVSGCINYLCNDKSCGTLLYIDVIVFVVDLLIGFGIGCSLIPTGETITTYYEPDSLFYDNNYCIAVLDGLVYHTGEARYVTKAKEGIVKIGKTEKLNSYELTCETYMTMYIFTKKEWEKLSPPERALEKK